ncbi:MAG: GNAT family N-acetyltransferase [Caldilineaceae bacterium]
MNQEARYEYEIDERLTPELRYREAPVQTVHSLPVRYCSLGPEDVPTAVSELEVIAFAQRFGAVAIAAEGIGGVETLPAYRQRGYLSHLLTRALEGMAQRVAVAFVSEAIDHLYEKFGFVTCLNEARFLLKLRNLEPLRQQRDQCLANRHLRTFTVTDLPEMIKLYNHAHSHRPWTHVRQPDWNRLRPRTTWDPGTAALVLEDGKTLVGYALFKGEIFGRPAASFTVDEFTAQDADAARQLLVAIAEHCWDLRLSEFTIREPLDTLVGWEARTLGCDYVQLLPTTGEMMGAILNRARLLRALEPELRRRVHDTHLFQEHEAAFKALLQGDLLPDNKVLLRLLLGFWSAVDAQWAGANIPAPWLRICLAWFPGGGTQALATPYAHTLDRY